jgi:transposase InsO family protein
MWPRRSHILSPLIDSAAGKKGKTKIIWTPAMDEAFAQVKQMISEEVFLTYPDWSMPFDIHTDASDKQLGAVISQNGKPIAFFSRRLSKTQRNYTTTEKELLSIVECLKQFRSILFGYELHVYSDHKNLIYEATLSESQRVMRWRLLLEEYGPHIHHIAGVDNIVADTLSRIKSSNVEEDENDIPTAENKIQELYANTRVRSIQADFPLAKELIREEQRIEMRSRNSELKKLIDDKDSGYYFEDIDDVKLILVDQKIYIPTSMRETTLNWYHHYLNHPGGDRLGNTIKETCYWKGLSSQAKKFVKTCKVCQQHKKKRKYGHVPAKVIEELMPWRTVHTDLIGPYSITAKQIQPGGELKEVELNLTAMTMVDPATGWVEIAEVPYYNIDDVKNNEQSYIDKSSARISRIFDQTWLSRYPRPKEIIFDNGSEFKMHFMTLLKDFDIKPKPTTVENPQGNSPVERIHQVVQNMIKTKQLDKFILDYIDPWAEILSSVAWAIRASYYSTLMSTPAQLVFGRDMLFNMKKAINWKLITKPIFQFDLYGSIFLIDIRWRFAPCSMVTALFV